MPGRLSPLFMTLAVACGAPVPEANDVSGDTAAPTSEPDLSASSAATVIPTAFHGVYDRKTAECAAPSVYRLTVSAGALRFHESLGTVRRVTSEGSDRIRIVADHQGEGETWTSERRLRLDQGGARLLVTENGVDTVRVRCTGPTTDFQPRWESSASGEGTGLHLQSAGGRQLTLFCPAVSRDLLVNVPAFRPVGSEERMSFGSDGIALILVANPSGDSSRGGVSGTGPVPAELERILTGTGLSVNYGAQNSGPHPAPPADLAATFVAGCRD